MPNSLVTTPYHHDVQSHGTPMVPSSTDANLGVVPVANADGTPLGETPAGSTRRSDGFQQTYDATSSTTPAVVVAATTSKSIYITDISISTDTAQTVKLQDNTGTPIVLVPRKFLPANSVYSKQYKTEVKVAVGKEIDVVCGGNSGNVTVEITGYVV